MTLDYKEAAHELRVTTELLKWCTRYAPKADGRKLQIGQDGTFDIEELRAFDEHLRADWTSRNVPDEFSRELEREARGQCGFCGSATDYLVEAHIDRKGIERDGYCQHPHNLILLCGECHARYDKRPKAAPVTNDAMTHAKRTLLNKLMEWIDNDVARTRAVEQVMEEAKTALMSRKPMSLFSLWQGHATELVETATAVTGFVGSVVAVPPDEALKHLSGALASESPITAAVVDAYAREAAGDEPYEPGSEWEHIPVSEPGRCVQDGELTCVEEYTCEDCDHTGYTMEQPSGIGENDDGYLVPFFDDDPRMRDPASPLVCEQCGSGKFEVTFEKLCSYCQHRADKIRDA